MKDHRVVPVLAACGWLLLCGCSRTVQTPKADELFEAVRKGDEAKIIALLDETPGLVNARSGKTRPLHVAARTAYPTSRIPRLLIKRGADVNARGEKGNTPLLIALLWGMDTTAEALVQNGADANAKNDEGTTPLAIANIRTEKYMRDFLRKHGAKE